jgi:excinuclease ABC subunit A
MTLLSIRGARAHNLKSVDLDLPHGKVVVFRGPSGSGKSSLALDVIHAESRRRMLELLRSPGTTAPALPHTPVHSITGLPPTIAVAPDDSERPDRSLAELTDIGAVLRNIFAREGVLHDPGSGQPIQAWTTPRVLASLSALADGTRLTITAPLPAPDKPERLLQELRRSGFARVRLGRRIVRLDELEKLPKNVPLELVVDRIKWGPDRAKRLTESLDTAWKAGDGVVHIEVGGEAQARAFGQARRGADGVVYPRPTPAQFDRYRTAGACAACAGAGCSECEQTGFGLLARNTWWANTTLPTLLATPMSSVRRVLEDAADVPQRVSALLDALCSLDLGHLTLGHSQRVLGRAEWRRAALARACWLADAPALLLLDEPLSGLSSAQARCTVELIQATARRGVSVIAIEHRPELATIADLQVEFGPGSGPEGGTVVRSGPSTPVAHWSQPRPRCSPGAPTWTAQHPQIPVPLSIVANTWTVLTGPSGSGTTRLAVHTLAAAHANRKLDPGCEVIGPEPRLIEPSLPAGAANARSCIATAAHIWSPLRTLLAATRAARVRGLGPDAFTFNRSSGWCSECEGLGEHILQFGSLPPVREPCPVCEGSRLRPDLDDIHWRGHSPRQLLELDVHAARALLSNNPKLAPILDALDTIGLGHLPLGRPTESLSSGERRRFSVARAVARLRSADRDPRPTLVVLDQPDAGLDDDTAGRVATWLAESTRGRGTLVTVAHHPSLLDAADAVVVLGSDAP